MKSKDKKVIKNKYAIILIICILLIYFAIVYFIYFNKQVSDASSSEIKEDLEISKANKINLDEIIDKNSKNSYTQDIETKEIELEYITKYKNNINLPKGTLQVVQEGRSGIQKIVVKKVYEGEELISEEQIAATVIKSSVDKIIEIGTSNYSSTYKVKKGDILYVTSDRLSVMADNNSESEKIATILKNAEVELLEISSEWYKISSSGITGWVKSEALTYINPNSNIEEIESSYGGITKEQALSKLNFNMNLNNPSGLSLEQFKKVLTDDKDKNNIFENNAQYFYYAEKQYGINGIFIAAVGIHESNWGTSNIAQNKCNLFGYGAYDSNPYNGAYNFSGYSESIDLISRVFVKYYLNPSGTTIYGGEKATGQYYSGNTLYDINKKYATDKNWANSVYTHMKYLYNKL